MFSGKRLTCGPSLREHGEGADVRIRLRISHDLDGAGASGTLKAFRPGALRSLRLDGGDDPPARVQVDPDRRSACRTAASVRRLVRIKSLSARALRVSRSAHVPSAKSGRTSRYRAKTDIKRYCG